LNIVENLLGGLAGGMKQYSSEFVIKHEKLDLRVCLLPSESLLPHEETIPDRVSELKESLLREGKVKDPIIVDSESLVVLDGMHREAAMRELQCLRMPACMVDYLSPHIGVGVWYRTLSGPLRRDQFEAALFSLGIEPERTTVNMTEILKKSGPAMIFAGGECLRLKSRDREIYDVLRTIERCARQQGAKITFETERDALEKLENNRTDAIIILPRVNKTSVRKAGLTRQLLPHKVTRHIIPARPLAVNAPLETLTDETMPLMAANTQFITTLRSREIIRRPPGTVIEGRRYDEETFVFNCITDNGNADPHIGAPE
jgi:hypothetical protein